MKPPYSLESKGRCEMQIALSFKVRASKLIKERTGESSVLYTKSVFCITGVPLLHQKGKTVQ